MSLRKLFNIVYPDGSRVKVNFGDKEQMLLAGELRPTSNPSVYAFAGQVCHMRSFADLSSVLSRLQDQTIRRRYLGLRLTFELRDKRQTENDMTPDGLALSLRSRGLITAELASDA